MSRDPIERSLEIEQAQLRGFARTMAEVEWLLLILVVLYLFIANPALARSIPVLVVLFGFAGFVRNYPRSPLAPSAQYWIGNAQFAQRDFRAAIAAQRQLIAAYPESQKVPDALLNIATSQIEMGDTVPARRTLEELIAKYPQSESAGKARQRLGIR